MGFGDWHLEAYFLQVALLLLEEDFRYQFLAVFMQESLDEKYLL